MAHDVANLPASAKTSSTSRGEEPGLRVFYEDNHLIAVFKEAGILSQRDSSTRNALLDLTKDWLKAKYAKPGRVFLGLLHRLDFEVSGVLLFAKTSKAASRLSSQFRAHQVEKNYWALVEGKPRAPSGVLEHTLLWDDETRRARVVESDAGGKKATLSYRTLSQQETWSHLQITLGTGRKHQIRAQLSALGLPIAGDNKYGARGKSPILGIGLTAVSLGFLHPVRAEKMEVALPAPLLRTLGWPIP